MKNTNDSRVLKHRESFFWALAEAISEDEYNYSIRVGDVCKRAGVSRATFDRNYSSVGEILKRKDEELIREFCKLNFCDSTPEIVWRKTLYFMVRNKEYFLFEFKFPRYHLLWRVFLAIRDVLPGTVVDDIFFIYCCEIWGVLRVWCLHGMEVEEIPALSRKLVVLAKTARIRLNI